jgi:hypothetical protein
VRRKQFDRGALNSGEAAGGPRGNWTIPDQSFLYFGRDDNEVSSIRFDFSRWRTGLAHEMAGLIQWQLHLLLDTHEGDYSKTTIAQECRSLTPLLDFLKDYAESTEQQITPNTFCDEHLVAFQTHLSSATQSERHRHNQFHSAVRILKRLKKKGLLPRLITIARRLPKGTRPKWGRGESALSDHERKRVTFALRTEINSIISSKDVPLTINDLGILALGIGLRTGRNTTPILRLDVDCIRPHFLANRAFIAFPKRRQKKTRLVPSPLPSKDHETDALTALPDTVNLIEHLKVRSATLRAHAPKSMSRLLFIAPRSPHRAPRVDDSNEDPGAAILRLTHARLGRSVQAFIDKYALKDDGGARLRLNIGRLRKTFTNRVFTLSDSNILESAAAAGHSPTTQEVHYLASPATAARDWKFMGELMADSLYKGDLKDFRTPTGSCLDPKDGEFAPKDGTTCTAFLQCFRCRSYVVTGDDLFKLFSLYYQLVAERDVVGKRAWNRHYSHIIRIIDRDVAERGVRTGTFSATQVSDARVAARSHPHPYWVPIIADHSGRFASP